MPDPEKVPDLQILECTLRDGNYAVDFKFTEEDASLLVRLLSELGFRWIEVGHGLGLGAGNSGKGKMPSSDAGIIRAARSVAGTARVGAFCIQGIASFDDLRAAREAGLDFVRIGVEASEVHQAFPYIEFSRKVGLIPFVNYMKTHTITPERFAETGRQAAEAGAEVVYGVDSSGGMLPEEVAAYFGALRSRSNCAMGFHAHNNLQLAVANAIQAYRSGARFIDATLYGLGRSAGNLPTEIAVAVFDKIGAPTGVDLFKVMEVAETYLEPLVSNIRMYDMPAVAMGYGLFHSSFLPAVEAAAQKHRVDLRRLIVEVGRQGAAGLTPEALEKTARSLPRSEKAPRQEALVSFPFQGITSETAIHASLDSVKSLIEGMVITASKRKSRAVLELTATPSPAEHFVLAEMALEDDEVVLGRVHFGSFAMLGEVVKAAGPHVSLYLWNAAGGAWADPIPGPVRESMGPDRMIVIDSRKLMDLHLQETLTQAAHRTSRSSLLVYGNPSQSLLDHAAALFKQVFLYGPPVTRAQGAVVLEDLSDLKHAGSRMDVILCLCQPYSTDSRAIGRLLGNGGVLLSVGGAPRLEADLGPEGPRIVHVSPDHAYRGQVKRWMQIEARQP